MTNETFWGKLDVITRKPQTTESTVELTAMLALGYRENLEVIISCIDDPEHLGCSFQSYVDTQLGRLMLCYTSYEHAEKEKRHLPNGDDRTAVNATAKCRSILDNVLKKPVIAGLSFNSDCRNAYIVPKELLRIILRDVLQMG